MRRGKAEEAAEGSEVLVAKGIGANLLKRNGLHTLDMFRLSRDCSLAGRCLARIFVAYALFRFRSRS